MDFTFSRKLTISGSGHVLAFEKGVPQYTPPALWREAEQQGGEPSETVPNVVVDTTEAPANPADKEAALFEAFEALKLKNDSKDFTAGGTPKVAAVSKFLGWDADGNEIAVAYAKFKQGV